MSVRSLNFSFFICCLCLCLVFSSFICQSLFLVFSISSFHPVHTGKFMPEPVRDWNSHQWSPKCRTQTQNLVVAPTSLGKGDDGARGPKGANKNIYTYISLPLSLKFALSFCQFFITPTFSTQNECFFFFDSIAQRKNRDRKTGGISQGWTETHSRPVARWGTVIKVEPNAIDVGKPNSTSLSLYEPNITNEKTCSATQPWQRSGYKGIHVKQTNGKYWEYSPWEDALRHPSCAKYKARTLSGQNKGCEGKTSKNLGLNNLNRCKDQTS